MTYLVMTVTESGERFPYYEQAESAREAVGKVMLYVDDRTQVEAVYKEIKTW